MALWQTTTIGTSMIRTLKVVWFSSFANCHCLNFLIQDQYIHILPDGQNTSNFKIFDNIFKLAHFKFLVQLMGAFQNTGANLQVPSDGFFTSAGCKLSDFVRFSDDCVLEFVLNNQSGDREQCSPHGGCWRVFAFYPNKDSWFNDVQIFLLEKQYQGNQSRRKT